MRHDFNLKVSSSVQKDSKPGLFARLFSSSPAAAEVPQIHRAVNLTRKSTLATRLELAGTSAARSKGLLGRSGLAEGEGLWIIPCESVHTFWMKFSIDLVYLDRMLRVKKVRSAVKPWRMSICLSAYSIIELPAGVIAASGTQPGDLLELTPHS